MATPTIITNAGTGNAFATNETLIDMSDKRYRAYARQAVLTTLLLRLNRMPSHNFLVDLIEENEIPTKVVVGATMAAGGTTLNVVDFGTTLVLDSILWNPTNSEYLRVTAAPTSNAISVTNHSGTTAQWNVGEEVIVLPPVITEDDENIRTSSAVDSRIYNYHQILKLSFKVTRLANKVHTQFGGAGSKRLQLQQQKFREFKVKDEQRKWFGARTTSGTAPATRYGTGGVISVLENGTLYKDFGGTFTESGWDNYLGNYFDQNPDAEKIAFFGAPNVIRQINYFAKDKLRLSTNTKKYGLNLNSYVGGMMDVDLIPTPIFNQSTPTKGWGFILDLNRIMIKELDGMVLEKDAKAMGESENIYDTYRAVDSLLIANESRHSMMVGADL